MAPLSRGLRMFAFAKHIEPTCSKCAPFTTYPFLQSGHNRWSKIKHDKGSADLKKNRERALMVRDITQATKLYGADPSLNSMLATVLATAKKAGLPKSTIESAIARGQGVSATGAALESLTLEAIMPPSIALVIDVETDNRKRALMDLRLVIKKHGGTVTPTTYLFKRRGRIQFEKDDRALGVDDVLDEAIEVGAEDVETDEDGNLIVWTDPSGTIAAAQKLGQRLSIKVESSDLLWNANEDTLIPLESKSELDKLEALVDALQEDSSVQGVYANVAQGNVDEQAWLGLQEKIGV